MLAFSLEVIFHVGIPVWISWIKYLSFVFYGYGQMVHIEYKDRVLYSCNDPGVAAGKPVHVITLLCPS